MHIISAGLSVYFVFSVVLYFCVCIDCSIWVFWHYFCCFDFFSFSCMVVFDLLWGLRCVLVFVMILVSLIFAELTQEGWRLNMEVKIKKNIKPHRLLFAQSVIYILVHQIIWKNRKNPTLQCFFFFLLFSPLFLDLHCS